MGETQDRLLSTAGGLLIAAGGVAAFTGGSLGLSAQRPGIIVWSVLLLMGYGVVGYLLMDRGPRYFHFALPSAAALVVATLFLFQTQTRSFIADDFFRFVIEPALALLLVFAGGALLTHVVEDMTLRVVWPGRAAKSLNALLHVGGYAPIWCAFTLLTVRGAAATSWDAMVTIGASVVVSLAAVVGGYAAGRGSHPAFTLAGGGLTFLACAFYLYEFMIGSRVSSAASLGQFHALVGLVLGALPIAISTVAWLQLAHEGEPAGPAPPQ